METCVFCDIVAGIAPASIDYEDEVVCAFLTIGPINPGHMLVIPKQHIPFLSDLNEETRSHLFTITMQNAGARASPHSAASNPSRDRSAHATRGGLSADASDAAGTAA